MPPPPIPQEKPIRIAHQSIVDEVLATFGFGHAQERAVKTKISSEEAEAIISAFSKVENQIKLFHEHLQSYITHFQNERLMAERLQRESNVPEILAKTAKILEKGLPFQERENIRKILETFIVNAIESIYHFNLEETNEARHYLINLQELVNRLILIGNVSAEISLLRDLNEKSINFLNHKLHELIARVRRKAMHTVA